MGAFANASFGAFPFGLASTSPFIGNWSPFVFAQIARLDTIEFDVTDETWAISNTLVRAVFDTGIVETVYAGTNFGSNYYRGSARRLIENGHRYILRRTGGWKGPNVRIHVLVTDLAGETVSGQSP